MGDVLARIASDHLRDDPAVTLHRVLLEAEQASAATAREAAGVRQLGLRLVAFHMRAEDPFHSLGMAGAHRIPPGFRRSECLQMDIPDSLLVQCRGELRFENPGLRDWGTARMSISSPTRAPFSAPSTSAMVRPS
jgi:hypothetical protein